MDSQTNDLQKNNEQEKMDNANENEKNNIIVKEELNINNRKPISSLKLENIVDFDENNYQKRTYNSNNIENGIQFFKLRYLQKKLREEKEKRTINNKKEIKTIIELKEKEKLSQFESLVSNSEKIKENIIKKYSYLFLILIEKSIIYFNLKKFKESYDILLDFNIIQNPIEFGEILFTINGYDRNLIGDFISKSVEPNAKLEVLKGYINSIEMNHFQNLLDCLKYICSKLVIPNATGQKTLLINELSLFYYECNKNDENFKKKYKNDPQNVGIFLNAIINTINSFSKNDDLKIQKDVFSLMVDFISKEEISKIYDRIKTMNLSLDNNYYCDLYERLNILLEEKKNIFNDKTEKKSNKFDQTNYYLYLEEKELIQAQNIYNIDIFKNFSVISNFHSFTQKDQQILTNIINLIRINGTNITNLKEYIFVEGFNKIAFEKKIADFKKLKHFIAIEDVNDIYLGTSHGENFKKYLKGFPEEENNQNNYMTIICSKEQIDFKFTDVIQGLKWYKSFKSLLFDRKKEINNKNNAKIEVEENKIKKEIEDIWKNYILGKWEAYGNYILFRSLDHSNYLKKDLNFEGKQQASIKIDIFEDKKTSLIKLVNNFLKEVKEKLSKKDDRVLEYNEFFVLCELGIADSFRQKIWQILIGNKCGITNILYESIKETITEINNFNELESKYFENPNSNLKENYILNEIIKDIIKIKYLFLDEIIRKNKDPNKLMSQVYSICLCFLLQKLDISYNKNMISIIYLFLLENISEKDAFANIYNLICSNNSLSKLYLWEDRFVKIIEIFFEEQFSEHIPRLKQYFQKLGITCNLYLYDWIEGLFTQTLNIKIASVIFELYLIYGEYILIQTSITILKILEEELLDLTIDEIFKELKRMPFNISFMDFFDVFRNYNSIKEKFRNNNAANEFAVQSAILFEPE